MKNMKTKTLLSALVAALLFIAAFFTQVRCQRVLAIELNTKTSTEYNMKLEMNTKRDFDVIKKEIKDAAKRSKKQIEQEINKTFRPVVPKEPTIDERKSTYTQIDDKLNLTMTQKIKFYNIMKDEQKTLKPMALDLNSKQIRFEELEKIQCDGLDFKCKKAKKDKIKVISDEIYESKRQIRIKKEYYMILYKNVLTRDQGLILDEIIHDKALGNYVNN